MCAKERENNALTTHFDRATVCKQKRTDFEDRAVHVDAMIGHRLEEDVVDAHVDLDSVLEAVVPVQHEIGLNDGHEAFRLANERVTSLSGSASSDWPRKKQFEQIQL